MTTLLLLMKRNGRGIARPLLLPHKNKLKNKFLFLSRWYKPEFSQDGQRNGGEATRADERARNPDAKPQSCDVADSAPPPDMMA